MSKYVNITGAPLDLGNGVVIPAGGTVDLREDVAVQFGGRLQRINEGPQLLIETPIGYAEQVDSDTHLNESTSY